MTVRLKGITWNHTRGYLPMVATAQRFAEMNPGVSIEWEKRSLQEFADAPIQDLVARYDLLVIDHPWAGYAAASGQLLDFVSALPVEYMNDQAMNTVGASHLSYNFDGKQTALAIDAATPVASWRPDLLERMGDPAPQIWEDVLAIARRGRVVVPAIPIDSLMNFYMFCVALGEEPFTGREQVVSGQTGTHALEALRELTSLCAEDIFKMNPIKVYEAMTKTDEYAYCPFAYGYSNYARPGYARRLLLFGDLAAYGPSGRLRSTLGGTGLAIAASSPNRDVAVRYAAYVASPETQRGLFAASGGQPGHREAWLHGSANAASSDYFVHTLPALDRAYVRPRYDGYLHFQDHAGDSVQAYLKGEMTADSALEHMNALYRESLAKGGV